MRRSATQYLGVTALLLLPLLSNIAAAEIYKWVDAQGNVHFGDKPKDSRIAGQAQEVEVVESYQPAVRTAEEQQAFDEQQRKSRLRDEMRRRDEQQAKAEQKSQHDQEHEALCARYAKAIEELETVSIKDGMRQVVYATDEEGKPLSSDQQRELIAKLKEKKARAGCPG
jgi:hypothetical protein